MCDELNLDIEPPTVPNALGINRLSVDLNRSSIKDKSLIDHNVNVSPMEEGDVAPRRFEVHVVFFCSIVRICSITTFTIVTIQPTKQRDDCRSKHHDEMDDQTVCFLH